MSNGASDSRKGHDLGGTITALVLIAVGLMCWWDTMRLPSAGAYVFPRAIIITMVLFCSLLIIRNLIGVEGTRDKPLPGSIPRRVALVVTLLLTAFLMPYLGFIVAALLAYIAIMAIAMYERWTRLRCWVYPLAGVAIVFAFYLLFDTLFHVPLPEAQWF